MFVNLKIAALGFELFGGTSLNDFTVMQNNVIGAELFKLNNVVARYDNRHIRGFVQFNNNFANRFYTLNIEAVSRLVKNKNVGVAHKRKSNTQTLFHTH